MRRFDRATRVGWSGLAIVVALSAMALAWRALFLPVVIGDALVCLLTVATTTSRLRALREQARRQEHESLHDPVTDLANRTLFQQQVNQAIPRVRRGDGVSAIMLLDLDRFKEVNDTLGHHQGDVLLHEVGVRLSSSVRAGDLIGRLGGDEFAVFAFDLESREEAFLLAGRVRESIAQRVELAGVALEVEASIGLSICPGDGDDVEELLSHADVAMYQAKRQHTGIELYDADTDESSRLRLGLLAELHTAIAEDQLVVHYQPKVESRTAQVEGFEALVRWNHPVRGLLYPDEFIALAENTGLMRPLTSRVLDLALGQCREWREAGHGDLTVAVNLSTRNLLDGALPQEVAERLAVHQLPASALELEITETTLMVDPVRAKAILVELAAIGVSLAIDDFGTGYTSLSWLGELPITTLKIDKSFVMRMTSHEKDEAIVRSSVQLGQNLGLDVVAEGIEHADTWRGLTELGCQYLQGYYFSRPQPADRVDAWLRGQSADVAV
jgi:diguanylate cyclase (GGDEF)-like protein